MPTLPQSRWAPGFGTELGRGAEYRLPMAAHCRMSPGACERVARSLDVHPPGPSLTRALPRLPWAHIPKIVHSLCGSLLINKHILPVHHGEGIEHRAQGLDGCGSNGGSGNSLLQIPLHTPPDPSCHHIPRETPMLGPILRREWTRITVPHTMSQEKWPGTNCIVAARYPRGAQLSSAA